MRLVVLDILSQGPGHGYELIKAIESLTCGYYAPSPGVMYPTLDFLNTQGLISTEEENGRKKITITAAGLRWLQAEQPHLNNIKARIQAKTVGHELRRHPEMKRALENLKATLNNRVNQQPLSDSELMRVVAILDDAAQAIALTGVTAPAETAKRQP
ncbi:PadR family transcriptional regulator [Entomohabitans teleogrylli]|uniref:PadR family transcriptional regulator n=1 Tax=Entomohabitans teleogrylli TaxID=1384589 RepID=UPI00073D9A99|nr:PadR family transcriptional regulator [Entomohabitans teleogrylli]